MMRVAIKYSPYNGRRYGKPWIGIISGWPVGGKPELEWGGYVGDAGGGEAEVDAAVGDVSRSGQKDQRGTRSLSSWHIVGSDGELVQVGPVEAREAWDKRQAEMAQGADNPLLAFTDEQLMAEMERRELSA